MNNFANMTPAELANRAERHPLYNHDPLFTIMVARLRRTHPDLQGLEVRDVRPESNTQTG